MLSFLPAANLDVVLNFCQLVLPASSSDSALSLLLVFAGLGSSPILVAACASGYRLAAADTTPGVDDGSGGGDGGGTGGVDGDAADPAAGVPSALRLFDMGRMSLGRTVSVSS